MPKASKGKNYQRRRSDFISQEKSVSLGDKYLLILT